jgi:hypothetical protein
MARIVSTGALVTVQPFLGSGEPQPGLVNLNFRLFALIDMGVPIFSAALQSQGMGLSRSSVGSLERLEDLAVSWRPRPDDEEAATAFRQNLWQPVVDELAKIDIQTDPETLAALDFEMVPVRAVRELFD